MADVALVAEPQQTPVGQAGDDGLGDVQPVFPYRAASWAASSRRGRGSSTSINVGSGARNVSRSESGSIARTRLN